MNKIKFFMGKNYKKFLLKILSQEKTFRSQNDYVSQIYLFQT